MLLVKGCSSIARLNSKLIARKSITRSFAAMNINGLLLNSQSLSNKSVLKFVATFSSVGTALYSTSRIASSASAGSDAPADFITTKSGLKYKDTVIETKGATVKDRDQVEVHYTGWLDAFETGRMFDSSYSRNQTFDFTVGAGDVIAGWDEALLTDMKVGSQRLVIIPPHLGFGPRGAGGVIPGNATLYFKMEVVGITNNDPPADFTTTKSGLAYKDTIVGTGATPQKGDKVKVHYTGWLKNFETGKKYDSSHDRFSPLDFTVGVGQVMQGWDEALLTDMKVGSQRLVIIPPELGYGPGGARGIIPGNATLYNKMELVAVNNSDTPADFTTTKSGLAYKDTVVGTGATPQRGDKVTVHYTGWLKNFETGKKFDSSYDRNEIFDFTVGAGEVIAGWDEALVTDMKMGSQRLMIIPPELGYGPGGTGGVVPGNATLYFKMELVGVNGK